MGNKKFGDTLRALRKANGFTQQQVADMLELKNKSTLGSWEVGKSEPDNRTLLSLCRIYGVTNFYSTFDATPPEEHTSGSSFDHFDPQSKKYLLLRDEPQKYAMLNDESKKIIEDLIEHLLELQKLHEQE